MTAPCLFDRTTYLLLALLSGSLDAAAQEDIEWRHRAAQGSVALTANPLRPASRAAFYEARGFSAQQIRPYSRACGFSFGVQNNGAQPIAVKLADWRAIGADGRAIAFKLPEHWETEWAQAGVPESARIAFRWAQFQSDIVFEPGDWIMGMATLASMPAEPFRLIARYRDIQGGNEGDNEEIHEIVLDPLACARD